MAHRRPEIPTDELDGLRLLALGRIPRCGSCPRFHALIDAHTRGAKIGGCLPAVPDHCTHQVCAPLSVRFGGSDADEAVARVKSLHLRAS